MKLSGYFLILPVMTLALAPASATALISNPTTIDGPSADIVDLGGAAMADDGSGGIVYRKREAGRAHVFVARFSAGKWHAPQRVDTGQQFDSSWPQIGAAPRGRLVATWVQEFGDADRMFSASLDPGANSFQGPVPIDLNLGEAVATYPSLAMNRGGSAYLAYRVLDPGGPNASLPPGYVNGEIRVQRYSGSFWSALGSTADRNPSAPFAVPNAGNSPKVGIDVAGNGLVVFQEPDDGFVDRIWARRIFGSALGVALLVSPQEHGGRPLRGAADAFSLDEAGFGQGAVAFRQQPGPDSALSGPHVFVNTIPESFDQNSGKFATARVADGSAGAALGADLAAPSIGVASDGAFLVGVGLGRSSLAVAGDGTGIRKPARLDDGRSSIAGDPVIELSDSEAAVAAWKVRRGTASGIGIQERTAEGVTDGKTVSASAGGTVDELRIAGSGLGDGIAAFKQGAPAGQLAAAVVDAPPLDFAVQTPLKFVRNQRVKVSWDPALNALSGVRYTLTVDDQEIVSGLTARSHALRTRALDDGNNQIRVIASDGAGQETQSAAASLKLDRRGPRASVRRRGRAVTVRVVDGRRRQSSGVRRARTRIRFGDGTAVKRKLRVRHRYSRGGVFTIVVTATDKAGNRRTTKKRIRL